VFGRCAWMHTRTIAGPKITPFRSNLSFPPCRFLYFFPTLFGLSNGTISLFISTPSLVKKSVGAVLIPATTLSSSLCGQKGVQAVCHAPPPSSGLCLPRETSTGRTPLVTFSPVLFSIPPGFWRVASQGLSNFFLADDSCFLVPF